MLAALAPQMLHVAAQLKKQHEMASPGEDLVFQSPACASIPLFLVLAGEGNATCPAHHLGSKTHTCLAPWLESYPCTAALQRCWWVEAADGREREGRAGEGAWKWLGWAFFPVRDVPAPGFARIREPGTAWARRHQSQASPTAGGYREGGGKWNFLGIF